jgi:phage terminase small subunit
MPNPPKPVEQKRLLGNPGKRAMPQPVMTLHSGRVEPPDYLRDAGRELWERVFNAGEIWLSPRLDFTVLERVCRALDRVIELERLFDADPSDRKVVMSINETDRVIMSGLGLLGFTPADRARLGLAEVKRQSKLQELMAEADEL